MTRKRTLHITWFRKRTISEPLAPETSAIVLDDLTGCARAVALGDDGIPAVIHHAGALWRKATHGTIPLDAKASDVVVRYNANGPEISPDVAFDFVVFCNDLYGRCQRQPAIVITYNPYGALLRLNYPNTISAERIPSDPVEIHFRLDEYAEAAACFADFSRRLPLRYVQQSAEALRVLVPELLEDHIETTLRALLPTIVTAFHRRLEALPQHMIQDWIALRTASVLPQQQVDRPELAALLGRLSQSGLDLIERNPECFGPHDWLKRASQYSMMLQRRLRPSVTTEEADVMLSGLIS